MRDLISYAGLTRSLFSKKPFKLNLYLTDLCNSRCSFCNIWKHQAHDELTLGEYERFFSKNGWFSWIDVTGGEIILRQDIEDIISVMIRMNPALSILHFPTNGTMPAKIFRLAKSITSSSSFKGNLLVTVSLDGPRNLHDLLRGKRSWDSAVKTYKALTNLSGCSVVFGFTASSENIEHYAGMLGELGDQGIDRPKVHINLAQQGWYYDNEHPGVAKDILGAKTEIVSFLQDRIDEKRIPVTPFSFMERTFLVHLKKYVETGKHPLSRCSALSSTVSISPDGSVFPCLHYGKRLGSLRENMYDLRPVLSSPSVLQIKKNVLDRCPGCWTACEAIPSLLSSYTAFFRRCPL